MLDRSNLNRIKGILSARKGAEIPKFLGGAKFAKEKNGKIIYSADGSTWFSDLNLTFPHMGSLEGFLDVSTPDVPQEFEIPGDTKITPNTAVETSAQVNKQVQQQQTQQAAEQAFQQPKLESLNLGPISLNTTPKIEELKMKKEISAGIQLIQDKYKQEQKEKQDKIMAMGQSGVDAFNNIGQTFGTKQSMSDSNLTKTVDSAYQGISNIASNFGPIGKAVGSIMKTASAAGNLIQEMGGGTDQQTKMDKWMDSSFFSWNVGMLNGFAGKKSDSFGVDNDILEKVGSSYGGTTNDLMDSAVMYTNHPGYTKIEVVCNKKQYMMRYVQSLNPAFFIEHKLSVTKTLNASMQYLFQPEFDDVVTVNIDDVNIDVYTGDNDIYASAEKFGKYITVMAENCRYEYDNEQHFAKFVYEQFLLAEDCAKRQIFREKPWYDIAYYIEQLNEPYVDMEYFTKEFYTF